MFVCNLTIKVDDEIEVQWLQWQKEEHIPEIMATNLFITNNFFKLLGQDDSEGSTYVLQYLTDTNEKYTAYLTEYAPALNEKALQKWGNSFVVFGTLMQTVH